MATGSGPKEARPPASTNWLEEYTFPEEARFAERAHADEVAEFFLDELLANGTTSALVFCTVHRASADAFFEAAERRNVRMCAGQVMMDRLCPPNLRDTPDSARKDAHELIERWDGRGRLHYAITPRFAITSSSEQLKLAGELARAHPSAFIHPHVAEHGERTDHVVDQLTDRPLRARCRLVVVSHGCAGNDRGGLVDPSLQPDQCIHG